MSSTSAPAIPVGTAVALAQRALSAALHARLAEQDVPPATYYTLTALTLRGPRLELAALESLLAFNGLDTAAVEAKVNELAMRGLVEREAGTVILTDLGRDELTRIREHTSPLTARLVADIDPGDLATAITVLQTLTSRADSITGNT